ncbi:MAG: GntR family transcriptional regulator [Lautropia sp.]
MRLPIQTRTMSSMPLPKYHKVYLVLKEQLEHGPGGDRLPGEFALMELFQVSRATVRKALERLAGEGLVSREAGRGTVSLRRSPSRASAGADPGAPAGFLGSTLAQSRVTSVRVLDNQLLPAPPAIAAALKMDEGTKVQKVVRTRSTAQGPVSHITTYTPLERGRGFSTRDLRRHQMLDLLKRRGAEIGGGTQVISACLADVDVAEILAVDVGAALLLGHRVIWDASDMPLMVLVGRYRPDRYRFEMNLGHSGSVDEARVAMDATERRTR